MVEYPEPYCNGSKIPHYFIELAPSIWICQRCLVPVWQPASWEVAERLSFAIKAKGLQKVYASQLNHMPEIRSVLEKLDALRIAKKHLPANELIELARDTLSSKEFKVLDKR